MTITRKEIVKETDKARTSDSYTTIRCNAYDGNDGYAVFATDTNDPEDIYIMVKGQESIIIPLRQLETIVNVLADFRAKHED